MKKIAALAVIFFFSTTQVFAAACYTPEQYRAEQAIRFHTQLMVIGMLCPKPYGHDAYGTYRDFTARHQEIIKAEENRLIAWFRQNKKPSPERALHSFRTEIANDASMRAMQSNGTFCRNMVKLYQSAKAMQPEDFKSWIAVSDRATPIASSKPLCTAASQRTK